ncbi:hypothetical protein DCAR_0622855 [Daucus carota subsp. sativus]|uniref:Dof zinc finger protein n=1 Tax=Daucus carota subsp. sativus TaxID=79200 RepID=A0A161XA60_DAUCS|nr:PREDICTED: dof zinc finger protein DOF5.4 [Daucus carota subsp. sativus]WOH03457.1 hypothetical protein DCAR_0622855 [Daucus carota subsp. sativus]
MQDMRIFNTGIDRRLRTNAAINHQQALKCPRCESLNTKFCYYNNYNLAQPRFYCKACRRYWTKGGVLRNVPVGGGIRKAKRSSKNKKLISTADQADAEKSAESNSSSERSSLTATTEVVSAPSTMSSCPNLFSFATDTNSSQFPVPQVNEPGFNQQNFIDPDSAGSMFSDIGQFTEIMASSTTDLGFSIADTSTFRSGNQNDDQVQQMQSIRRCELYLEETTRIESKESDTKMSNDGLTDVEWRVDDQEIYDLTGNVDEAYWSQNQWPDHHSDHSFHFHLP